MIRIGLHSDTFFERPVWDVKNDIWKIKSKSFFVDTVMDRDYKTCFNKMADEMADVALMLFLSMN